MADSDNTTTLSLVTRRKALGEMAIVMSGCEPAAFLRKKMKAQQSSDPAVEVWCKWKVAYEETDRLCRQQQRLERTLVETVGFPCVTIQLSNGECVTVHSPKALRDLLDPDPELAAMYATAETDLAAHQARWDAADKEIGYSAALDAESEAGGRVEDMLNLLAETPAASLAGVAAKLDVVLRQGQPSEDDDEFPWPQLRSVFEDIDRIGKLSEPD
ncbi:hypothetical protein [Mesorhizobium sp. NPDC059025]|uniref:hypothetical protein n=1 Tax=unclassified Mesorhizobium TaxID=325217 RepID=UPI0036A834CE